MRQPNPPRPKIPRARKIKLAAAALGLVLGVACGYVPPEYQAACNAVADLTSIPSGCI